MIIVPTEPRILHCRLTKLICCKKLCRTGSTPVRHFSLTRMPFHFGTNLMNLKIFSSVWPENGWNPVYQSMSDEELVQECAKNTDPEEGGVGKRFDRDIKLV